MTKLLDSREAVMERYVRCNRAPFMNKEIYNAIISKTRLLNKFRKNRSNENRNAYNKTAKVLCETLKILKTAKKIFYSNIDVKRITDNKLFWKTVKPNFD